MVYLDRSQGKRDVSGFTKLIDVQNDYPSKDQGQKQQSTRGTPATINTMSTSYAPTVSDGEKVVDDAWKAHEDDHHEDSEDDEDDHVVDHLEESDLEDAELEDKFHCRPRYQHSRIDVSIKTTFTYQ